MPDDWVRFVIFELMGRVGRVWGALAAFRARGPGRRAIGFVLQFRGGKVLRGVAPCGFLLRAGIRAGDWGLSWDVSPGCIHPGLSGCASWASNSGGLVRGGDAARAPRGRNPAVLLGF